METLLDCLTLRGFLRSVKLLAKLLALMAVFGAALYWVHVHTRDNYRTIGITYGKIEQSGETYRLIKESMVVHACDRDATKPPTELVSSKPYSIYVTPNDDGSVTFCEYEVDGARKPAGG